MHIAQFLDALFLTVNVEVVIARLPEGPFRAPQRHGQFERLHYARQCAATRLAYQQVNVLGHHDIARDNEAISPPDALQRGLEKFTGLRGIQVRTPPVTTESEEMKVASLLVSHESTGHLRLGYIAACAVLLSQVPKCEGPGAPTV